MNVRANMEPHILSHLLIIIVLDTTLDGSSYDNNCFSYVTSSNNNEIDAITWHARLGP